MAARSRDRAITETVFLHPLDSQKFHQNGRSVKRATEAIDSFKTLFKELLIIVSILTSPTYAVIRFR